MESPSRGWAAVRPPALRLAGGAMIVFGLLYPHFLPAGTGWSYAYRAPTGLIPCPTLSLAVGIALFCGGLGSRAWPAALAGLGLFYGLFGTFRLRVGLDVGLLAGASFLMIAVLAKKRPVK